MTRSARWQVLLWPLSLLYSGVVRVRGWCYRRNLLPQRRLPGIVISVGNITVGGTGKTPMVMWLGEELAKEGKSTAVLTRGYRGTRERTGNGPERGEPQSDEVAVLRENFAGRVKIGVGADRYSAGEALARHGTEWFVMDDGFQHSQLARQTDIVLIDATDPFGGGMMLPAGRLREPISALRRADLVVVTRAIQGCVPAIEVVVRRYTSSPIFCAATNLKSVLRVPQLAVEMSAGDWRAERWFAFAGLGNPGAFFDDVRRWNFEIVGQRPFPDHHVYTQDEISALAGAAKEAGADALLCTEKDVWNLRHVSLAEMMPVYCCRIALSLPEPMFRNAIDEVIARNGRRMAQ